MSACMYACMYFKHAHGCGILWGREEAASASASFFVLSFLCDKDMRRGPHRVNVEAAREAIDLGCDVDFRFFHELTPLLILCTADGYIDLKRRLLEVRTMYL
jgi:hypothetical protein